MTGDEESSTELLSGYLEWRKAHLKYRRLENVYLLVALGVIGWYASTAEGDLLQFKLSFDGLFFGFAAIAFAFVVLKVNSLALSEMTDSKTVAVLDNRVAPLLFFWGFNGVVLSALTRPLVAGQQPLELVVVVVDFLASFVVSVMISGVSSEFSTTLRDREATLDRRLRGRELTTAVFENPELVESGFVPTGRGPIRTEMGDRLDVDIIGKDTDDSTVLVRVDDRVGERRALEFLEQLEKAPDKRWVLVSPSFSSEAESILQSEDIEYVEVATP